MEFPFPLYGLAWFRFGSLKYCGEYSVFFYFSFLTAHLSHRHFWHLPCWDRKKKIIRGKKHGFTWLWGWNLILVSFKCENNTVNTFFSWTAYMDFFLKFSLEIRKLQVLTSSQIMPLRHLILTLSSASGLLIAWYPPWLHISTRSYPFHS